MQCTIAPRDRDDVDAGQPREPDLAEGEQRGLPPEGRQEQVQAARAGEGERVGHGDVRRGHILALQRVGIADVGARFLDGDRVRGQGAAAEGARLVAGVDEGAQEVGADQAGGTRGEDAREARAACGRARSRQWLEVPKVQAIIRYVGYPDHTRRYR